MASGASIIIRYSAGVYENKINTLEALNQRLMNHLSVLEELKERIPTFWEDQSTAGYVVKLSKAISEVKNKSDDVMALRVQYEETFREQNRVSSTIDEQIESINERSEKATEQINGTIDHFHDEMRKDLETAGKILPTITALGG